MIGKFRGKRSARNGPPLVPGYRVPERRPVLPPTVDPNAPRQTYAPISVPTLPGVVQSGSFISGNRRHELTILDKPALLIVRNGDAALTVFRGYYTPKTGVSPFGNAALGVLPFIAGRVAWLWSPGVWYIDVQCDGRVDFDIVFVDSLEIGQEMIRSLANDIPSTSAIVDEDQELSGLAGPTVILTAAQMLQCRAVRIQNVSEPDAPVRIQFASETLSTSRGLLLLALRRVPAKCDELFLSGDAMVFCRVSGMSIDAAVDAVVSVTRYLWAWRVY